MACFWLNSHETTLKIEETEEKDGIIFYKIHVFLGKISWEVSHRYNDFFELHNKLVNDHGVAKDILPSKKLLNNKSPEFIDCRRKGLEIYLHKILKFLKLTMPRIFIEFLDFHKYDVFFLLQSLALKFYSESEVSLSSINAYDFNTLEMHAISRCCNTPLPEKYNPDKNNDITHVLDFCSQLITLNVNGTSGSYLQSNIKTNELLYDFRIFKKVVFLSMNEICLDNIQDLGQLRHNLKTFSINRSKITCLSDILQCDVLHKSAFDGTQVWENLVQLDLSYNCLSKIDQSLKLLPNLKVLLLDQNGFSKVPDLQEIRSLNTLSICGNLISSCQNLHESIRHILHLNVSHNGISSLEAFSQLNSLESLNLTGNHINNIEEIKYLCKLPSLGNLILTGNNVSTIVDYRIKVLEYFSLRAVQICLDNEQPSQPELDKVSIRRALRILKEGAIPDILHAH